MAISRSALKNYKGGGVNPAGADQPFILRDPPKSITTRKKETVEMGDVQYMVQTDNPNGDPTRINENIRLFAKKINPFVEVQTPAGFGAMNNWNNMGVSALTSEEKRIDLSRLKSAGNDILSNTVTVNNPVNHYGSNPYKVEVVRPPLYPVELRQPLSAPRIHQNYAVHTNPGNAPISISGLFDHTRVNQVAQVERTNGLIRSNPASQYRDVVPMFLRENYDINTKDSLNVSALSSLSKDGNTFFGELDGSRNKEALNKAVNSNFSSIVLYDPKTNVAVDVNSNLREKNYMAVNAALGNPIVVTTGDGTNISVKDYNYKVVNSNIGNDQVVISVNQPDVFLERNTPLYSLDSTASLPIGYNEDLQVVGKDSISLSKLASFGSYDDRAISPLRDPYQNVPVNSGMKGKGKTF